MAIRISKVTRELNVGSATLVDFLHKKGFADVVDDLNQKLSDEQYNLLVAEFSQDKSIREEANRFLQERQTRRTVEEPVQESKPEPVVETVLPEEPVIKFKTVGKINLDKPKAEPKPEPKPEP
ncbi:MAG: translation initiation factor IF-2, partial [Bacteroidetes bacterium]|nr:translation initiation factor IF-2 [Candidatus Colenecus caballi]